MKLHTQKVKPQAAYRAAEGEIEAWTDLIARNLNVKNLEQMDAAGRMMWNIWAELDRGAEPLDWDVHRVESLSTIYSVLLDHNCGMPCQI